MGLLISIEGGEYVGKTSLVVPALKRIAQELGLSGFSSREPGGTEKGEKMRREIFEKAAQQIDPYELTLLFNKARRLHIEEFIKPSLENADAVVILDRYLDSTRVYQGFEGGIDLDEIRKLEREYVGDLFPDLTLILYFPLNSFTETYKARKLHTAHAKKTTPWDDSHLDIHIKRQEFYMRLPALSQKWGEMRAFAQIDASQNPSEVVKQCVIACAPFFKKIKPELTDERILEVFEKLTKEGFFDELTS